MRTLVIIPVLFFSMLLGATSYSADFNKGLTAAQNGDFATALKEWKPLAEKGDIDAQYNLVLMYRRGDGVSQDYKEAVRWCTLAAKQGYANAQFTLGFMYDNGEGVPQDYKEAYIWWSLATVGGHKKAKEFLEPMEAKLSPAQLVDAQERS